MRTSVRWQLTLPCSLVGLLCVLLAQGQARAASGLPNGRIVLKAYDGRYVSAMWNGSGEVQVFGERPDAWEYLDVFNQSNSWELLRREARGGVVRAGRRG